jgi:hypothetical protein
MDTQSPEIKDLITALCKARPDFPPILKSKTNPQFRSAYADINDIRVAVIPTLCRHGVWIQQGTQMVEGVVMLVTTLLHAPTGQFLRSYIPLMADMNKPQSTGSAQTYFSRYQLCGMLSLAVDEDYDGEEPHKGNGVVAEVSISNAQAVLLAKELEGHDDIKTRLLGSYGLETVIDLPRIEFQKVLEGVRLMKEKKSYKAQ